MNTKEVKPITIFQSSWYFIISSVLIYLGLYVLTPLLLDKGVPFIVCYLSLFYIPFALLFFTALMLYKLEGNAWNISDFKSRMQLNRLEKADWLGIIGIILVSSVITLAGTPIMSNLAQIPFFQPSRLFSRRNQP